MGIDTRTRRRADVRDLAVHEVFGDLLREAVEAHGDLVADEIERRQLPPLRIESGDLGVTLSADDGSLAVTTSPDRAGVVAVVTETGLSNLAQDMQTPMGLAMTSRVEITTGRLDDWLAWEPALHALFDGRPPYREGAVELVEKDGSPLDLHRSFTLDDDADDSGWFLEQAGFLHVRGVFDEAEMAAVGADLDACLSECTPDDGESWWATDADASSRPCVCSGSTNDPRRSPGCWPTAGSTGSPT